jgi:hypothetical protein
MAPRSGSRYRGSGEVPGGDTGSPVGILTIASDCTDGPGSRGGVAAESTSTH